MDIRNISAIEVSPINKIELAKGDVFHGLKNTDSSFKGFGELYFSFIKPNEIKAWKKHIRMTCNFIVPVGKIKFVIFDSRTESVSFGELFEIVLSPENYFRLTVPPGLWYGFRGESDSINMVVNLSNIVHDPGEQFYLEQNDPSIDYKW